MAGFPEFREWYTAETFRPNDLTLFVRSYQQLLGTCGKRRMLDTKLAREIPVDLGSQAQADVVLLEYELACSLFSALPRLRLPEEKKFEFQDERFYVMRTDFHGNDVIDIKIKGEEGAVHGLFCTLSHSGFPRSDISRSDYDLEDPNGPFMHYHLVGTNTTLEECAEICRVVSRALAEHHGDSELLWECRFGGSPPNLSSRFREYDEVLGRVGLRYDRVPLGATTANTTTTSVTSPSEKAPAEVVDLTGSSTDREAERAVPETEEESTTCCICEDSPADTVVYPCGHRSVCRSCSETLKSDPLNSSKCIICRERIEEILEEGVGLYSVAQKRHRAT